MLCSYVMMNNSLLELTVLGLYVCLNSVPLAGCVCVCVCVCILCLLWDVCLCACILCLLQNGCVCLCVYSVPFVGWVCVCLCLCVYPVQSAGYVWVCVFCARARAVCVCVWIVCRWQDICASLCVCPSLLPGRQLTETMSALYNRLAESHSSAHLERPSERTFTVFPQCGSSVFYEKISSESC